MAHPEDHQQQEMQWSPGAVPCREFTPTGNGASKMEPEEVKPAADQLC